MSILKLCEIKNFQAAINKGLNDLKKLDPERAAQNARGHFCADKRTYSLKCLGMDIHLELETGKIVLPDIHNDHVCGSLAVLTLHYLIHARPGMLRNRHLSYRELPNGEVFYRAFKNLSIDPIATRFGNDMKTFEERALSLGGCRAPHGEMSYEFMFFPRLPVTYIIWGGDREIPPAANIVFDASAPDQLHTEDLAEVGEVITHLLLHK